MLAKEFLIEYRRDVTAQKLGDKLLASAKRENITDIDKILAALEDMDPTSNKQYTLWIANQYNKGQFRLEDSPRIKTALERFIQAKSRLQEKDIGRYDFYRLEDEMEKIFNPDVGKSEPQTTDTFEIPEEIKDQVEVLYNGPLGLLAVPKTKKASCVLGSGTRWCTASRENNYFGSYNRYAPLYIWRDKNGEKYQFYFNKNNYQFANSKDRDISKKQLEYFATEHPVLKKLFHLAAKKLIKNDKISWNDLRSFVEAVGKKSLPSEIIDIISKSPSLSFDYASNVINGRFPEGEEAIAKISRLAYHYATELIKRRFPLGEKAIATDPYRAYVYARDVILGRWPPGEKAIFKNSYFTYLYAKDVIRGRFPEGEKSIAKDPEYAYRYATRILRRRFPEGEKSIATYRYYADKYRKFIASRKKSVAKKKITGKKK